MADDLLDFAGKAVVVTGAAAGIGRACALAFAQRGAMVVLADIDAEKNATAAADIAGKAGSQTLAVACNVANDGDCARLIAETLERFGRIDVLINNAGVVAKGDVLDLDLDDFDRVIGVNLRAAFVLTQLAARRMVDAGIRGAIVNMSSVNAELAIPNQLAYVTSKGGLGQLTKVAALGLAPHGVRVNAIGPGSIMTDILRQVMTDEAARQMILSRTPLGRVGEPGEVAAVALFLASDMASYITGQTIYPDGGRLALNYLVPVDDA
ncbi:MAG: SDR family NAD(P)-dependent oxidoreductase [Pseudomonadota bacterium]|nr:SDR family NAD(P)-dependent oxidoreductase [Pseudomonadota bacterium]